MRRRVWSGLLAVALSVAVVDCATKAQTGALIGAGAGAATGAAVTGGSGWGLLVGGMLGGMLGAIIGNAMDEQDRRNVALALENNRTGQPSTWTNPDTGNAYTVTPTETIESGQGAPCREFTVDATVGGKPEQTYGTACRQPDGSWKIVQ